LAGGIFAIALRGIPFSISAAVGFIAVSGVAVLNGLVLTASIQRRFDAGEVGASAIFNGALERLRPVLITALGASLGASGTGAEVQKPRPNDLPPGAFAISHHGPPGEPRIAGAARPVRYVRDWEIETA